MILPASFYQRENVVQISQQLLGKVLVTYIDGQYTSGIIVETEAYNGYNDLACHAHGKRTNRTETMYSEGGMAYIYLCYGIHHLFNVVTNEKEKADAVLIRAIEPLEGLDIMISRRKKEKIDYKLTQGPGSLSQALGIHTSMMGTSLINKKKIWIEDRDNKVSETQIVSSLRVGVGYAREDALLPWRFYLKENPWVSRREKNLDEKIQKFGLAKGDKLKVSD
ncbi:DNA-3-methyladenine glycosylase [Fulvivirgaceae bacterium BMA10]|uniref:Putative 3-methyladenine DNA glycosylase n=1 Tax=Splendidivirga corallicola TaxID=3051826 RepID=A0ABT8KV05_9BACT|nr:DNA-3-methyladenine glycosylase [Fulvivirgaceae bacterium BMA10]